MKIYQKAPGKWVIDFTCRGRRIRRVIEGNKTIAENVAATIKADIIRNKYGIPGPQKRILFENFADEYIELHSKQNKRSWKRDLTSLKNLRAFFGGKFLSEITPDLIEKYKAKRKAEVKPASVNRELALLKHMYTKAIDWNKATENPVKKVKLLREDNKKERILSKEEIKRLIEAAEQSDSYVKQFIIIGLNTGMRKDEILSLKWENIDFRNMFINVTHAKSGKSRKIPMNTVVKKALESIEKKNDYVFFNPKTKSYTKNITKAFKTVCRKAGIKNFRIHDLRHTAATKMIEAGVDLVTVSKILGHSSIQMTMRYAHPTQANMRNAVEKLGELFEMPKKETKNQEYVSDLLKPLAHIFLYN